MGIGNQQGVLDRIITASMKRMTAQQTAQGQIYTLEQSEPFHRLDGVLGASRDEATTRRKKGGHGHLIHPDGSHGDAYRPTRQAWVHIIFRAD